jgi:glycerophosphoryl diester phosphodiesterase
MNITPMKKRFRINPSRHQLVLITLILMSCVTVAKKSDAQLPFYNAFSHNDYHRPNPLRDALSFRFNAVEADLHLIDGELYVSHDKPKDLLNTPTFENLYIKPLVSRIEKNGGSVYPLTNRPFYLMIDFKTNGEEAYKVLLEKLKPFAKYFCSVNNGKFKQSAILLFCSGNRPLQSIQSSSQRFVFLDGLVEELNKNIPATLTPVISDNYGARFTWRGIGEMPAAELENLRKIVKQAHQEGKLFRFWGAPDTEQFKRFFLREGIDLVGTDNLKILYDILSE